MTKTERITALLANEHNPLKSQKALEAATEDELKTLEAHCKTAADAKTAAATAATEAAARAAEAAKKPKTEDEFLADAPESIRTLVADKKAADAAEKVTLVTTLKAAQKAYTEEELKALDLPQLRKLAAIAKVETTVDYSGRMPRTAENTGDYFKQAPPNGYRIALDKASKTPEQKEKVQ